MYIPTTGVPQYPTQPPSRCPHCGYCPHCGHAPNPFTTHWAPGTVTITGGQLGGAMTGFNGGQISDNVQRS